MNWTYKIGDTVPGWVTDPVSFTESFNGKTREINTLIGIHHVTGSSSDGSVYTGFYAPMPLETHISKLAHEFKTPLNTIIGYSQLMLDRDATPEVNEKIGIVLKAARHLNTLISDVVDFSKLEAKSFTFNLAPHKSKDMINDCMNYMLTAVSDKKIALIDRLSLDTPTLFVDDRRFKQIIINILSNAIKYGVQHGKIEIIENCDIRERSYELKIIDDGIRIIARRIPRKIPKKISKSFLANL
jgi:signal transduction histidine kinase